MKVSDLVEKYGFAVCTDTELEHDVSGCYVGDLLSWVMANAQADAAWITIQTNVNIVAVASLNDLACIICAEGAIPDDKAIEKANDKDVVILRSDKTAYEICCMIYNMLQS